MRGGTSRGASDMRRSRHEHVKVYQSGMMGMGRESRDEEISQAQGEKTSEHAAACSAVYQVAAVGRVQGITRRNSERGIHSGLINRWVFTC